MFIVRDSWKLSISQLVFPSLLHFLHWLELSLEQEKIISSLAQCTLVTISAVGTLSNTCTPPIRSLILGIAEARTRRTETVSQGNWLSQCSVLCISALLGWTFGCKELSPTNTLYYCYRDSSTQLHSLPTRIQHSRLQSADCSPMRPHLLLVLHHTLDPTRKGKLISFY